MVLWRWDHSQVGWKAVPFPPGEVFPLGLQLKFVPLKSGRYGLLVVGRVTVNGVPALPLRVLQDKDEIRIIDGERLYFSSDGPAEVIQFSGGTSVRCGRCQGPMQEGKGAVCCPRCGAWHHQTGELPCWTCDQQCSGSGCGRPTSGAAWQPESLVPRSEGVLAG